MYDKEKVDIETVAVEDVFKLLQCDDQGLSGEEAARRLEIFGPNKLENEEQTLFLQVRIFALILSSELFIGATCATVSLVHAELALLGHGGISA